MLSEGLIVEKSLDFDISLQNCLQPGNSRVRPVSENCVHHQVVTPSLRGFPPRKIWRCYKTFGRPGPVCGSNLSGISASCRRMRTLSLHAAKFRFPKRAGDGAGDGADRGFRPANRGWRLMRLWSIKPER
jgi:hypothetical protein